MRNYLLDIFIIWHSAKSDLFCFSLGEVVEVGMSAGSGGVCVWGGSAGSVGIGLIRLDFKALSTTRCHISTSIIEDVFHDKMVKTKNVLRSPMGMGTL